jgi:hypothetical protein
MKYIAYILTLFLLPAFCTAQQARVNITSGYMQIGTTVNSSGNSSNPTYLVLDDSSNTALKASAGSGVLSSGEFNMIEWNIGHAAAGTAYVIPWISDDLVSIPLTVTITTAGVNNVFAAHKNASIEFSTWHTIADQFSGTTSITGLPSNCTNFDAGGKYLGVPSATDDSYEVVDRFWIIDATSGSGKAYKAGSAPGMSMIFTYLAAGDATGSEVSTPNVFVDGSLIAQRYNSTLNEWGDYTPTTNSDVVGATTSVLTTAAVTPANFFRDWTLSYSISPLPINLIGFTAQCQDNTAVFHWSTASENNNDFFTLERTDDGVNYQQVMIVKGAGNSSSTLNYTATDYNPFPGTSYYRLSQTDMDGHTVNVGSLAFNHCETDNTSINAFGVNNNIKIQINSVDNSDDYYTLALSNAVGQIVLTENKTVTKGFNEFVLSPALPEGVYFITVSNSANTYHKKILITH